MTSMFKESCNWTMIFVLLYYVYYTLYSINRAVCPLSILSAFALLLYSRPEYSIHFQPFKE